MLTLRPLTELDITVRYLAWFADPEVTKYLEVRNPTKQESIDYIRRGQETGDYHLYAIIVDGVHIGNLKIGPIQHHHGLSDLVTVIGDKEYWGKGYATQAIKKGMEIAWQMGIRKLSAGICSGNKGSIQAYVGAGFHIEAVLKKHYIINGNLQGRVCVSAFACK
jgi:[ribosomal protein S5]-alanine N-acetyltransferase